MEHHPSPGLVEALERLVHELEVLAAEISRS
jgi:hypothetical protein